MNGHDDWQFRHRCSLLYRRDLTSRCGRNVVVSRSRHRMTHDLATGQDVTLKRG
jgi:hypothetical protein